MRSLAGVAVRNGRVFVARRKPGGDMGGRWEFPGGKREPGETDAEALKREYDEEFDLAVGVGRLLGESSFAHAGTRYELAAWTVTLPRDPTELREHEEFAWLDKAALLAADLADSDRSLLPFVLPLLG